MKISARAALHRHAARLAAQPDARILGRPVHSHSAQGRLIKNTLGRTSSSLRYIGVGKYYVVVQTQATCGLHGRVK
jgi:hypothetical protein